MTLTAELFFVGGSFVIGVIQMVEARALLRQRGNLFAGMVPYTSAIEFLWTLFALFLLVTGRLDSARWLAIMLLVYSPIAILAAFLLDPEDFKRTSSEMRAPKAGAWLGGLFGALYASAALVFLVR